MSGRPARPDLQAAALASLAAALVALVVRMAEPFEHGAWLVAYLVLVGFLAQLLLGRGQAALLSSGDLPVPSRSKRLAQVALWNLGVLAVPLGVLVDTRLAVVVGSISLLAALASLWMTVRPHRLRGRAPEPAGLGLRRPSPEHDRKRLRRIRAGVGDPMDLS